MDLVFFLASPEEAGGVASSDDLPNHCAAEPIRVAGPRALLDLMGRVAPTTELPLARPLRDATCQSFPIWTIAESFCSALARMDEEEVDARAEGWSTGSDTDAYERAMELMELRDALRERASGESLYALFEERVL